MNNNVKNAAIGLLMMGTGTGALLGFGYMFDKDVKKNKFELFTTDPEKAQEALDIENMSSTAVFEAERKIHNVDSAMTANEIFIQKLQKFAEKHPEEKEYANMCINGLRDSSLNIVSIKRFYKDRGISLEDSIK